jgi:heptosyltransferase-2
VAHLVFQTAFPGDLFLSIPLLKRLRVWNPENSITLACRPGLGGFFLENHLVDEVIEIDKKSAAGRAAALTRLRAETWDVVLVPHESVRTALWMRGLKARTAKISFRRWWNGWIYHPRVDKPMAFPDALRQLSLLAPLDSHLADLFAAPEIDALRNPSGRDGWVDLREVEIPSWASMRVREAKVSEAGADVEAGSLTEKLAARKIFLAPGSVWATKRWPARSYEELAHLLLARGFQVELVGSPAEKAICDEIAGRVGGGIVNRAGRTSLSDLVNLFTTGAALICNDSGAMHAAAAAGLPVVALFGPTTLDLGFRPWTERAIVVQRDLSCRPCGKHGAMECPIGTHECMRAIPASEVFEALIRVLSV